MVYCVAGGPKDGQICLKASQGGLLIPLDTKCPRDKCLFPDVYLNSVVELQLDQDLRATIVLGTNDAIVLLLGLVV